MKLHALLSGVPHKGPALDPEITAVVYDSRKAGPGALFVCLPLLETVLAMITGLL